MQFTLEVQFTGLGMHIVHSNGKEVAVVLPDARELQGPVRHEDLEPAEAHVAYLRMNLAHLDLTGSAAVVPNGQHQPNMLDDADPPVELVHRFTGETLSFGLTETASPIAVTLNVPSMDDVAPGLGLAPDLFALPTAARGRSWVMRTCLQGGTLSSPTSETKELWSIERRLFGATQQAPVVSDFRGDVIWTRTVNAAGLTLTSTALDGTTMQLPLVPINGRIRLKIANLCRENPLEWSELPIREPTLEDADFKWFYKLLAVPPGGWLTALDGMYLPAPRLIREKSQASGQPGGNCAPTRIKADFPPATSWS